MSKAKGYHNIRNISIEDKHLQPIDKVSISFFLGFGGDTQDITARIRFRHRNRTDRFSLTYRREVFPLLFLPSLKEHRFASDPCTPKLSAQAGAPLQNSSIMMVFSKNPNPPPPYFSSIKTPTNPNLEAFSNISRLKVSSISHSLAIFGNSPSVNSLAVVLISSWPALN